MAVARVALVALALSACVGGASASAAAPASYFTKSCGGPTATLKYLRKELPTICKFMEGTFGTAPIALTGVGTNDKKRDLATGRVKGFGGKADQYNPNGHCTGGKARGFCPSKQQCDEFPYASTAEGGDTGLPTKRGVVISNCVPAHENAKQGGALSALYKECGYKAFTVQCVNALTNTAASKSTAAAKKTPAKKRFVALVRRVLDGRDEGLDADALDV
jgi:hypothetical protein